MKKMWQIPPPTISTVGEIINSKKNKTNFTKSPIPHGLRGKSQHQSSPTFGWVRGGFEARGCPQKKPPDFTPMAWCFAINQTLLLAAA